MKKIILSLAAVAMAICANATITPVTVGEKTISAAITAATAGDTLELSTGEYTEWNTIMIEKEIHIIAAENEKPVLHTPKICPNAEFEINGVEIYLNGDDYLFRTTVGGSFSVAFKNCLLRDTKTVFYYLSSGQTINNLIVDNCIFKNNTVRAENGVLNGQGTIGNVSVTNTTIYNISGSYAIRLLNGTSATIDHCTFYQCGERPILIGESGGFANAAVSNCIIANPTEVTGYCIATYGGTVDNCLYYNTAQGPRSSQATVTGCINADPLFVDAANANFTLGTGSPAINAGTDGKCIGDLRWAPASTPTAVENANANEGINKVIRNGKVVIIRDGVEYSILGQML